MTDVVTGEAVVLDVRAARLPTRSLALFLDVLLQFGLLLSVFTVAAEVGSVADDALTQTVTLVATLLVLVGYPVTLESLSRGRSFGKMVLGIRVVSDDGGPERFRQALFRGLTGFVEIWLTAGVVALITSLCSQHGRRLGDIFAGTIAVRQRTPVRGGPVASMPPQLAGWAAGLELSGLTDELALTARQYTSRYDELGPQARDEMGRRIASAVAQQVTPAPPAGTSPPAYLSAVLAERRRREENRLAARQGAQGWYGQYGWYGQGPAPGRQEPYGTERPHPADTAGDEGGEPVEGGSAGSRSPTSRRQGSPGGFVPPS